MEIKEFMVERWLNTFELGAHYNLAETDAKPYPEELFPGRPVALSLSWP